MMKFVYERTKNIVGKGENAGYVLRFPQRFQKVTYSGWLKFRIG